MDFPELETDRLRLRMIEDGDLNGCTGYWIGEPYQTRGYMSEALRAVLRFGFEQRSVACFEAGVFADSPASFYLLDKVGFRNVDEESIPSKGRGDTMVSHIRLASPKADFVEPAQAEGCTS